jgi:hypothetical protein
MNLKENIHRIKKMMGLNESVVPFELFGITERLIGYKTANFALYAHLFSKLYDAYEKGNLEKEYSILMSDDNANKKMVKYFYNFIINNTKFFEDKEVFTESNIHNHINEEKNPPRFISSKVDDVVYGVIDDMIRLNYGEIRIEIHSNNDGELDTTLLYDYNGDLIGEISRAYSNRNPEYNTLWIEKGDADKFVDSLTRYVPFDRAIREDYVKNYFQFEHGQGKRILYILSRDRY